MFGLRVLTATKALRVLRLLEEQHRKLASLVKSQDNLQHEGTSEEVKPTGARPASKDISSTSPPPGKAGPSKAKATTSALASTRIGSQIRDSSPSLARDIASRRGIPPPGRTQPSAAAQARARQLSPESRRRAQPGGAAKVPPSIVDSQAGLQQPKTVEKAEDDEGFTKFYSNLTSGTMSKLSSVLAYAGLPLTAEDLQPDQTSKQKPEKRTVSAGNEPDVKKIFSKAALDAIEDEHRQRGTFGHGFGPGESFYVVQKGGGTYSYADIAKAHQHQLSRIGEDEEAEFVDAKEMPGPPSPKRSRFSHQRRDSFGSPRTQEELELENTTLKNTLEQVAGRLAAFETHAQDASMAALTQSMASLRPGANEALKETATEGQLDAAVQERLQQLESQLQQQAEERQKLETHAIKQEKILRKYKAKWDELKENARERDKAKKEKSEKTADDIAGDGVVGE